PRTGRAPGPGAPHGVARIDATRSSQVPVRKPFVLADRDATVASLQEVVVRGTGLLVPAAQVPEAPPLEPQLGAALAVQDRPGLGLGRRAETRESVHRTRLVDQRYRARHIAVAQRRLRSEQQHLRALRQRDVRAVI